MVELHAYYKTAIKENKLIKQNMKKKKMKFDSDNIQ